MEVDTLLLSYAIELMEEETATPVGFGDRGEFIHGLSRAGAPYLMYFADVLTRVLAGEKPSQAEESADKTSPLSR